MSRLFDDATSDHIRVDSAPVTAAPFTISVWFYPDEDQDSTVLWIGDKDVSNQWWRLQLRVTSLAARFGVRTSAGEVFAVTSNAMTLNAWHHAAAIETSNVDHACVLNGDWANRGTNTTDRSPAGADRITIGVTDDSTPTDFASGRVAEVAVWSAALAQGEIEALAKGYSPLGIRRSALVYYAPLIRNVQDIVGGLALTDVNGTTVADHVPLITPLAPHRIVAAAAGGTPQHYYRRRMAA